MNMTRNMLDESSTHDAISEILTPPKRRKATRKRTVDSDYQDNILRYAVEYGTDLIWDTQMLIPMRPSALRLAIGSAAYKEWFADPARRVVRPDQIVFDPSNTCSEDCINLFQGWPVIPMKGSCVDILELLMHLVSKSATDDAGILSVLHYVLDWMAYPLQYPGAKMASAIVFHGPQGTGKNLLWEIYASIYGKYAIVIGQAQLESQFNDWVSKKLFIIGDEIVAPSDQAHQKNALKSLVTGDTIQINIKMQPLRTERNAANFVFLSNDNKPLALERDDRRHLVVYCPEKRLDGLYERVKASLSTGAVGAFYEFLLGRDLSGFHPHAQPVMTLAKSDLVELGLRPAERFTREWLEGEIELPLHPCSTGQLYKAFQRWCRSTGERMPPNQAYFSTAVGKYARDRLTSKKASPSPTDSGSAVKIWLPAGTGPLNGVRWYDFAKECIDAFDLPLSRFSSQGVNHDQ
jgi:putative DNA primase/helicase